MKKLHFRKIGIFLVILMVLESIWSLNLVYGESALGQQDSVVVTTPEEFLTALSQGEKNITISGNLTVSLGADNSGKMYPLVIPGETYIQGQGASCINFRCPMQLGGENVTFANIELLFSSSDALGSVPHREIFLAGHKLTLDNVKTYLEGSDGSLGGLGGSEAELLPSVYAGGFEQSLVGINAHLVVKNGNEKTVFQGIYMSHDSQEDNKVSYKGTASVEISPKISVRDGIYTNENTSASIYISGAGNISQLKLVGNAGTTLQVQQSNLYAIEVEQIGKVILKDNAYMELQQGELQDITIQEQACLDLCKIPTGVIRGTFIGGVTSNQEGKDTRGILVMAKEGHVQIDGTISNITFLHIGNRYFPEDYTVGKEYIHGANVKQGDVGFVLPESKVEFYTMYYETGGWYLSQNYEESWPTIQAVEIVSAPQAVDVSKIKGSKEVPAEQAPSCTVYWKGKEGKALSFSAVNYYLLYSVDTILGVKSSYWTGEEYLEQTDWGNVIQFVTKAGAENQYYFYVDEEYTAKTGEYTFLFCDEYCDPMPKTVADIKALKEHIKAQMPVYFYDSTKENGEDAISLTQESIVMTQILDQVYTGSMLTPEVELVHGQEKLVAGKDYIVTYENNIQVGTKQAVAIVIGIGKYCGTLRQNFSIVKKTPELLCYANGTSTRNVEYESQINFSVQVEPYLASNTETKDMIAFYSGNCLLGTAIIDEKGQASFSYQTTEQKIPVGESEIVVKFSGNDGLGAAESRLTVALRKKQISVNEISGIQLKDIIFDGKTKNTELVSVTTTGGKEYPAQGSAELSSAEEGIYTNAKVLSWSLSGAVGSWYELPDIPETIAVVPWVKIEVAIKPEETPVMPALTLAPGDVLEVTQSPMVTGVPESTKNPMTDETIVPGETKTPQDMETQKPANTIAPCETKTPQNMETQRPANTITPCETKTPQEVDTQRPENTIAPGETKTPQDMETQRPAENITPGETKTPQDTETQKPANTITPGETKTPQNIATKSPVNTIAPEQTKLPLDEETQKPAQTSMPEQTDDKDKMLKKGDLFTHKKTKAVYKVIKAGKKSGTVEYVSPTKTNVTKVEIPASVVVDGITYKVTSVRTKACYNMKHVKVLIIGKNVTKIGTKAFYGCKRLKKIYINTEKLTRKTIGTKAFSKGNQSITVKVPKNKRKLYGKICKEKGMSKNAIFIK